MGAGTYTYGDNVLIGMKWLFHFTKREATGTGHTGCVPERQMTEYRLRSASTIKKKVMWFRSWAKSLWEFPAKSLAPLQSSHRALAWF